MTEQALPLRFVNTPTVKEIYEQEHEGEDLGLDDEDVEKLSDEYDRAGSEGYYHRVVFSYLKSQQRSLTDVTGNEGFGEWVKKTVTGFIESVKKFFAWLWSFFGGKKEQVERKAKALDERLKEHGAKTGDIPYAKTYIQAWGSPKPVPASLDWLGGVIDALGKAVGQVESHHTAFKAFVESVKSINYKDGPFISDKKSKLDAEVTKYGNATKSAYGNIPVGEWKEWVGIGLISIGKDGKVTVSVNNKILPQGDKQPTFKTNTTQVENLLKKFVIVLEKWDKLSKDQADLEQVVIKQFNNAMSWEDSTDIKNAKSAEEIVKGMKKISNDMILSIKGQANLFANVGTAISTLLDSTVQGGSSSSEKGDKK